MHQHKSSHERSNSGDGIWLSGRDLFHLESALGIVQGGGASQRLRVISEEARNVHLQRLALENAMLSAVLELESVLRYIIMKHIVCSPILDKTQLLAIV